MKNADTRVMTAVHGPTKAMTLKLVMGGGTTREYTYEMLDSDARVSLIEEDLFSRVECKTFDKEKIRMAGITRATVPITGIRKITLDYGHGEFSQ